MVRYENHCCDCASPAYPCLGDRCPLRHMKALYCDSCGEEAEELCDVGGDELCEECALQALERGNRGECASCGEETDDIYILDDKPLCRFCAVEGMKKVVI